MLVSAILLTALAQPATPLPIEPQPPGTIVLVPPASVFNQGFGYGQGAYPPEVIPVPAPPLPRDVPPLPPGKPEPRRTPTAPPSIDPGIDPKIDRDLPRRNP